MSGWVKSLRLSFFGHLARTAPKEDHHRVIAATLRPPADWRRPVSHSRTTWLRTIDDDLQWLNFGVHTTWRKVRDRGRLTSSRQYGNASLTAEFANKEEDIVRMNQRRCPQPATLILCMRLNKNVYSSLYALKH